MIDLESSYTRKERAKYAAKRQSVPWLAFLVPLVLLYLFGDSVWLKDTLHLLAAGIPRFGAWAILFLLFTKFGLPKLDVQTQINSGNVAAALAYGLVAVAIAVAL